MILFRPNLNETLLGSPISNGKISISGYDIVKKKSTWGDVAILIRQEINYKIRNDLMNKEFVMIMLEILSRKLKAFLVNTSYRPASSLFQCFDYFEQCITKMDCTNKEIILVGYYNFDWTKLLDNNGTSHTLKMRTLQILFNLSN